MQTRTMWVAGLMLIAFAAQSEAAGLGGMPGLTSSRIWHVGLAGGMSVPIGDTKDALKNGFHGQGFFSIDTPHLPIGLKASLNYSHFDFKPPAAGSTGGATSGTGTILSGLANGQYHLLPGPIRPYIIAGVGAFSVGSEVNSGGTETKDSKVHFGVNGGAGLDFHLGSIRGFVEGRYDNIFTEKGLNSNLSADNIKTQVIPVSLGLIF